MSIRKSILIVMLMMSTIVLASPHEFKHFKLKRNFQQVDVNGLPPVIDKLWDTVKKNGYKAVNAALKRILRYKDRVPLGQHHFPELTWSTGLDANVEVAFIRRLEPMLNSDHWRVFDRIILGIGAQAYLRNLRDHGEIEISDSQLRLFAGIFFKREYSYEHYAQTYKEGLKSDLDKLLLSFKKFKGHNFVELEQGEIIRRDDYLSAEIGMSVETPSIYWMSVNGLATVYFTKLENLTYQNFFDPRTYSNDLKVSYQKMKVKGTRLQLELQLDFYKLLKVTLFGTEYSRSLTNSRISTFKFDEEQVDLIKNDPEISDAFVKVNKGKDPEELPALAPFKNSVEDSISINESMSMFALMWGKYWGNTTEGIIFSKWGSNRFLYRHQQERVSFDRKLLDVIFRSDNLSKFKSREVENMLFEYETPIQRDDFSQIKLSDKQNISFRMSKEYIAKKNRSSDRKRVKELIETFETVDGGIVQGIDNGKIKAPFFLDLHAQVGKAGILNIFTHSLFEMNRMYGYLCAGRWLEPRGKISKTVRRCMDKLARYFKPVHEEYHFNQKIALKEMKIFLSYMTQKSKSFYILKKLFGEENVQLYGTFRGETEEESQRHLFQTFIKEGDFQGYGVVKDTVLNR